MTEYEIFETLPQPVKDVMVNQLGWLVGSAVDRVIRGMEESDYDLIVENNEMFHDALLFLKSQTKIPMEATRLGAIRFNIHGVRIDIWCQKVGYFLFNANWVTYIFSVDMENNKYILLKK